MGQDLASHAAGRPCAQRQVRAVGCSASCRQQRRTLLVGERRERDTLVTQNDVLLPIAKRQIHGCDGRAGDGLYGPMFQTRPGPRTSSKSMAYIGFTHSLNMLRPESAACIAPAAEGHHDVGKVSCTRLRASHCPDVLCLRQFVAALLALVVALSAASDNVLDFP